MPRRHSPTRRDIEKDRRKIHNFLRTWDIDHDEPPTMAVMTTSLGITRDVIETEITRMTRYGWPRSDLVSDDQR